MLLPDPGDLMLVGEKFAVMPDGCPLTLRLTAVLKVEVTVVLTETVVLLPTRIVAALVDAVMLNVAGTETTRLTVADFVVPPEVAVTVTLEVPAMAFMPALKVSTELPDPGADNVPGLKLAVTPVGKPVTDRVTGALNPLLTVTLALNVAELAAAKFKLAGALNKNDGGGGATPSLQCDTSMLASTEPRPEA